MSQATEQIARQYANAAINRKQWNFAYNALAEGLVGDGVTDDTAALQALINKAIAAGRRTIIFPHGEYYVTTLTNENQVDFIGDNSTFVGGYTGTIGGIGGFAALQADFTNLKNLEEAIGKNPGIDITGISDSYSKIQTDLNNGYPVKLPKGTIRVSQTIVIPEGGVLEGCGEETILTASFAAGPVVKYGGGRPFILRNMKIDRSVTAVSGASGVEIGFTSTWAGRGYIGDLYISNQWDGLKWKGGSFNVFSNIVCENNKGHGFFGFNPRGTLQNCLSIYNYGNGYNIYQDGTGDSGLVFQGCGTFANQNWGYAISSLNSSVWCGNYYFDNCTSSTDGRGGFVNTCNVTQLFINQFFIETAGYARGFNAAFADFPTAIGMEFFGYVEKSMLNNVFICNSKGIGFKISPNSNRLNITNLTVWGNGSNNVAANKAGLSISGPTSKIVISGFNANTAGENGNTQDAGFAINSSDVGVLISGGVVDNYYIAGGTPGTNTKLKNIVGYDI